MFSAYEHQVKLSGTLIAAASHSVSERLLLKDWIGIFSCGRIG